VYLATQLAGRSETLLWVPTPFDCEAERFYVSGE
jgi:hypothetical protein